MAKRRIRDVLPAIVLGAGAMGLGACGGDPRIFGAGGGATITTASSSSSSGSTTATSTSSSAASSSSSSSGAVCVVGQGKVGDCYVGP
jgi:hypothetical protein